MSTEDIFCRHIDLNIKRSDDDLWTLTMSIIDKGGHKIEISKDQRYTIAKDIIENLK